MAALLNGREYGSEITRDEATLAEASGLVVAFGYSDDNMEIRGAWGEDEFGCYDGGSWKIGSAGFLKDWDSIDHDDETECEAYFKAKPSATKQLTAIWCPQDLGCSWAYELDIPHASFDIMEDGDLFCRGIVFAVADLVVAATPGDDAIASGGAE